MALENADGDNVTVNLPDCTSQKFKVVYGCDMRQSTIED